MSTSDVEYESAPLSHLDEGSGSAKTGETHGETTQVVGPVHLRKLIFSKELKMLIIQAVRLHNTRTAPHGEKDEIFCKVRTTHISNSPASAWRHIQHPDLKTL